MQKINNMSTKPQETTEKLKVIAREPFSIYFEGFADAFSAENKVGQFDILPGHADFFSILESGDILIDTQPEQIKINIKNGIITVHENEVMLFLNI